MKLHLLLIVIILCLNCCFISSTPIVDNGISLLDVSVSSQNVNISNSISSSVTFQFTIQGSTNVPIEEDVYGGIISFKTSSQFIKEKITWNILFNGDGITDNTVNITVCVPLYLVGNCDLSRQIDQIQCIYSIKVNHKDRTQSVFLNSQILQEFPSANVILYSNIRLPVVNGFTMSIHPLAPLVSFIIDAQQFGEGFTEIIISLRIPDHGNSLVNLNSNGAFTTNGLYYVEGLLSNRGAGGVHVIYLLTLIDSNENILTLTTQDLQDMFNISSFTLPKTSAYFPTLFDISPPPSSLTFYANQFSTLIFNISLADYTLPIFVSNSGPSTCQTFYRTSTFIQIYCSIPEGLATFENNPIQIYSGNSNSEQLYSYYFNYENANKKDPNFTNIQYSLERIDELEPLYIEMNISFICYNSYLNSLFFEFTGNQIFNVQLNLNNLISGSIGNGTANAYIYFDSVVNSFSTYSFFLSDIKDFTYVNENQPGIPTTMRRVSNNLTLELFFGSNTIDLSNSSFAFLPFLVKTVSNPDTYLKSSSIGVEGGNFDSPSTDFTNKQSGGIISVNETTNGQIETLYQTYVQIYKNFSDFQYGGEFLMGFDFYYGTKYLDLIYSKECVNIIINNQLQPTMVTEFIASSSNPVNSSEVEFILYYLETKGGPVDSATIVFYETEIQQQLQVTSPTEFPCLIASPYDFNSLVASFDCPVPISNFPSQVIPFYILLTIEGVSAVIWNIQLQESGFPSVIEIVGLEDTGLVPNITEFQTSFDPTSNSITVDYSITTPSNLPLSQVNIVLFNKGILRDYQGEVIIQISNSINQGLYIDLCNLEGFEYNWQDIGIYLSIISPIPNIHYDFPYEYLLTLDSNKMDFPINLSICDYSAPRLTDMGILNYQESYDTTYQSYQIQVYFDITDDISGFSQLSALIQSTDYINNYFDPISVTPYDIVSGNTINGQYVYNFTLPQYTNGNYSFQIQYLEDQAGNQRPLTNQNQLLISTKPFSFTAISNEINPNLPTLISITNDYSFPYNNLIAIVQGQIADISLISNSIGVYNSTIYFQNSGEQDTYTLSQFNPPSPTGTYTFSLCITSLSLSTQCYSWLNLKNLGFSYTFSSYNP